MKSIPFLVILLISLNSLAQPYNATNCRTCNTTDIEEVREINTKYLGVKGRNPSIPSTYKLVGDRKFCCGEAWDDASFLVGKNWFPIRTQKQIFRGKFDHFAVNTYGEESDWDIYLSPDEGFEEFRDEALAYKFGYDIFPFNWPKDKYGNYCIEAEITPPNEKYSNIWFNNSQNGSFSDAFNANNYLIGKTICAYGPFVREYSHGNHPEIHPSEQIWWKENDNLTNILLVGDGSGRFDYIGDYNTENAVAGHKAWTPSTKLEAELKIPFKINPSKEAVFYNISAIDDFNFYTGANYPDISSGISHKIEYAGKTVVTIQEPAIYDQYLGITFSNICYNIETGTLQGIIVINTATGNGYRKEGFVLLQIDKRETKFNQKPVLKWGNLLNTWNTFNPKYDNSIFFESLLSTDKTGKGIINGSIDFNGNGITDFFAVNGGNWMVMTDGKGPWEKINRSHIPVNNLRFGDVDGDKKTDVLFADLNGDVFVAYKGSEKWVKISAVEENSRDIYVGDFNGDGKTDLIYCTTSTGILSGNKEKRNIYVKYNCNQEKQLLNENFELNIGDFEKYFRFGHFNIDKKTDIFRYDNNRFLVYWGGAGDYEILNNNPGNGIKMENILFATNFSTEGLTDVVAVDPLNKKWTTYYGGKPGSLPMPMTTANIDKIHFANIQGNSGYEPFIMEYVAAEPEDSHDIVFEDVEKIKTSPFISTEYKQGSLRKISKSGGSTLVYDMDVIYHPGSNPTDDGNSDYTNISRITNKDGSIGPSFKKEVQEKDQGKLLGTIEAIRADNKIDTELDLLFGPKEKKRKLLLPAFSIGAHTANIYQTRSTSGNWTAWTQYLKLQKNVSVATINKMKTAPGITEKIKNIQFELHPFYSSLEKGNISMVEMGAPMQELNGIVYGKSQEKITELLGDINPFRCKWSFQLKNLSSNTILDIQSAMPEISDGKWKGHKISYSYPETDDLLQFTATAIITDAIGNLAVKPIELNFYNQQITTNNNEDALKAWIENIASPQRKEFLFRRASYLLNEGLLTPEILATLLK